jgi:hypothetical protein
MTRIFKSVIVFFLFLSINAKSAILLIPMDEQQTNHLRSYGIAYWALTKGIKVDWLLNYRGGSFSFQHSSMAEVECRLKGVSFEVLPDVRYSRIVDEILNPEANMDVVKLEKTPKIAVYSPKTKQPWDDAVTLAMTYAEIPYDIIYDDEVMEGKLPMYDWLHLHHEDFTGQFGKFYAAYRNATWYKEEVKEAKAAAARWGFDKPSLLKRAVVFKIRDFVAGGGYLFAMCSAPETFDIALAASELDICEDVFDGDPSTPNYNSKLDYSKTFAFENFTLSTNPYEYLHSTVDVDKWRPMSENEDFFTIFTFSAKADPIPSMLTQNHKNIIKSFMGQTTAFRKKHVKSNVLVMGENKGVDEDKYIHGVYGKGMFTFYGGHDPEDYQHMVGEPPTDLNLYPNSPSYRLILNNVLFPAAEKQKRKT